MGAHVIEIGEPAHENERAALAFLAEGLPSSATVFTNPWLSQPSGAVFELDAVVILPHAIFVVEIKAWGGHVRGGTRDWVLHRGGVRRSPLLLGRKTAQILHSLLRRRSHDAGRAWVQELVFLPAAQRFDGSPRAVASRVATSDTLHAMLLEEERVAGWCNGRRVGPVTGEVITELMQLLKSPPTEQPPQRIAGYRVEDRLDANDRYTEVLGRDATDTRRLLRIYRLPWNADATERAAIEKRALWEARVLRSFERAPPDLGLPRVLTPVQTDQGLVVPMEHFEGLSIPAWVARYAEHLDLPQRVTLWSRIARGLDWIHDRGVVHRHLGADLVLVAQPEDEAHIDTARIPFRITGFDLAKHLERDTTIAASSISLDRLEGAAPEVVLAMSSAEPRSDQFSLGLILALLVLREPLVESTLPYVERRQRLPRVRDRDPDLPQRLDDALSRMLERRPTDRYPDVAAALSAVHAAVDPGPAPHPEGVLEPGAHIGPDYLVESTLGHGGLADVYKVKHLLRGERFAIKVARLVDAAETALRCEFYALRSLDHPQVVGAHDLSRMVEGRVTLILDYVEGATLTEAAAELRPGDTASRRRLAEDLLGVLDTFERVGMSHNDLKPDNLMVTPSGRLVIIDFSLAHSRLVEEKVRERPMFGGTWEWRDPNGSHGHPADRYAAAMCLFWLHAGRHPFDDAAPEPDEAPELDPAELDPPGLAPFFERALHPDPERRFRTAQAMRDAYLAALGAAAPVDTPSIDDLDADTPLSQTELPPRAVRHLVAAQVRTVGALLALSPDELRAIHGLGEQMIAHLSAFARAAQEADIPARPAPRSSAPPFFRPLTEALDPVSDLPADAPLLDALSTAGLRTVGEVARSTRVELLGVKGIGPKTLVRLGEALVTFHERTRSRSAEQVHTLDGLWESATRRLDDDTRQLLAHTLGLVGGQRTQNDIAAELDLDPAVLSTRKTEALQRLDRAALMPVLDTLDGYLDGDHGLLPVSLAAARLARDLPVAGLDPVGMVRLATVLDTADFGWISDVHDLTDAVLVRPDWYDRATLRTFVETVTRLVDAWPPTPAAPARTTLQMVLPDYQGDPLVLAARLVPELRTTRGGAPFRPPVNPVDAVSYVLEDERDGLSLPELQDRIQEVFDGYGPEIPAAHELAGHLEGSAWKVSGNRVVRRHQPPPTPEPSVSTGLDDFYRGDLDPQQQIVTRLRAAGQGGSTYRLVVAAPQHDVTIGDSLARALGATRVDLASEWFQRHEATLARDARASRLEPLRVDASRRLHALFDELVEAHGHPGRTVVITRTGLLAALGGLDEVRLLYNRVSGRGKGFWILVVPGIVPDHTPRQPLFNGQHPIWQQPGLVLPLNAPVPTESP